MHGAENVALFPEADDDKNVRQNYADENTKANEYLFRRVDLEDVVSAHVLAAKHAHRIGFGRYIVSATTAFLPEDMPKVRSNASMVVLRRVPNFAAEYERRGWKMVPTIDRVYVNERARTELNWRPRYDFHYIVERLIAGENTQSRLARLVGSKGYHAEKFAEGPYPVE